MNALVSLVGQLIYKPVILLKLMSVLYILVKKRAGPPPERKPEGSIDVIGGENSRGWQIVEYLPDSTRN